MDGISPDIILLTHYLSIHYPLLDGSGYFLCQFFVSPEVTFKVFSRIYDITVMKTDHLTTSFIALRDKLHRSALGFLRNEEDASDALQDTFCKLWNGNKIMNDNEARNKLFAVLRNVCIDRLRSPRCRSLEDIEVSYHEEPPDMDVSSGDLEKILTANLSELQLRIYRLIAHENIEYEDVAARLGMSVEAVRMNMCRARKKIRDNYKRFDK